MLTFLSETPLGLNLLCKLPVWYCGRLKRVIFLLTCGSVASSCCDERQSCVRVAAFSVLYGSATTR